jgi:cytochrome c oxidase subunit 2
VIDPSNYTFGLPIQASTYAGQVDRSLDIVHAGMVVIFLSWGLFFTLALVRFRRGVHPKARAMRGKSSLRSFLPEVAVLLFEIWLIFIVGLPIWANIKEQFPSPNASLTVDLVAEQFAWTFQYAGPNKTLGSRDPALMSATNQLGLNRSEVASRDDVVTINELYVPLGRPTILYMTSKDVIHSFFVPEFRVKQDIVPGMRTPLWFEPTRPGRYEISCAQLCGLGHYRMRGEVVVLPADEFAAWELERQKELKEDSR